VACHPAAIDVITILVVAATILVVAATIVLVVATIAVVVATIAVVVATAAILVATIAVVVATIAVVVATIAVVVATIAVVVATIAVVVATILVVVATTKAIFTRASRRALGAVTRSVPRFQRCSVALDAGRRSGERSLHEGRAGRGTRAAGKNFPAIRVVRVKPDVAITDTPAERDAHRTGWGPGRSRGISRVCSRPRRIHGSVTMAVVPDGRLKKVQYFENHIDPFTTNAVAIGLTAAEATDLQTKTEAARQAYNDQQAALLAAKNATATFYNAVITMNTAGSACIKKIRAMAETSGDPTVYTKAQIPAPPTPTPVGPLGTPSDFKAKLDAATGALNLSWKCSNPANATGMVYQIWRQIGATGELVYLGGVGAKKYTDADLPRGTAQVQYQIQAVRSTSVGPFALFIVNFGSGSSGAMTVTEAAPARLAA
jgi:hypothetical protein